MSDIDRDRDQHDQRELHRIDEHHPDEHQGEDQIEQRRQALPGQKAADRLQFAHARDRLPRRAGLEIGERQAEEMMEQPPPEFDVDPVGGVAQRIGAQKLQRSSRTGPASPCRRPAPPASTCPCGPAPCRPPAGRRSGSPARTAARTARRSARASAAAGSARSTARTSGSRSCWGRPPRRRAGG